MKEKMEYLEDNLDLETLQHMISDMMIDFEHLYFELNTHDNLITHYTDNIKDLILACQHDSYNVDDEYIVVRYNHLISYNENEMIEQIMNNKEIIMYTYLKMIENDDIMNSAIGWIVEQYNNERNS